MLEVLTTTDIRLIAGGGNCLSSEHLWLRSCANGCISGGCAAFSITSMTSIPQPKAQHEEDRTYSKWIAARIIFFSVAGCLAGCFTGGGVS